MGGGGGSSPRIRDLDDLLKTAKEELQKPSPKDNEQSRKNVFISFAYEDINEVNLLRGQAKNDNLDLEFNDWSVRAPFDSDRASYIKEKILERISSSSVTVVYISKHTKESSWVKWEVEQSLNLGKKVIAMHSGSPPPTAPSFMKTNKIKLVSWSKLADEIDKL